MYGGAGHGQRKIPIALRVYFPDSSSRSLIMDSATIASELVRQIGRKLDADAQLWTGFGIYIETDDFGTVAKIGGPGE